MIARLCSALLVLLTPLCSLPAQDNDDSGFQRLFNGRNLDGWVRVNTAPSTWTVKDGLLICSGKPIGELRTKRMYQKFILELEWRHMKPKGNAGVFVWADDITAKGVPFHRSVEVQVLENAYGNTRSYTTHGDIFPIHGAKMTPINGRGGSRAFPTENRSKPGPEWNHYRIVCQDGEISLAVNGKVVTRGKDCSPREGYICLESEGGIVHYRNLRIKELPATPVAAADVAIRDRGYRCLYQGIDLSGWKTASGNKGHWQPNDWILHWDGKSFASEHSLTTNEVFENFGFVFDVRLKPDSGTPSIDFRGSPAGRMLLSAGNPDLKEYLGKPGSWNRFEGRLRGNRLTLTVNGQSVFQDHVLKDIPKKGPLRINPDGPIDFANIYVN